MIFRMLTAKEYLIPEDSQPLRIRELEKPFAVSVLRDLDGGRDGLEQLYQLGEPVIRHPVAIGKNTKAFYSTTEAISSLPTSRRGLQV